ncbi:flagellar export protein FliJ [Saliterribacillus persicus]|nr:flagellar export protein FliJ [Saliterribacillus persicus]
MAKEMVYEKILSFRETEKNEAQMHYQTSMEKFEAVALKLVDLLQKKEKYEEQYYRYLERNTDVSTINMYYNYLRKIEEDISQVQRKVNKARDDMNKKQDHLTTQHVEVKKIEKIIDRKRLQLLEHEEFEERKMMDDISTRQFLGNKGRG